MYSIVAAGGGEAVRAPPWSASLAAHRRHPLDERDPESECLARSGRRLCKDVTSGERIGQNERLNAKRLDDVERRERLLNGRAYAKRVE